MSAQSASGLQLPNDEQTRSVILSYLIHHGHRDTAQAFMAEVARREDAESTEKCPLWGEIQQLSNPGSPIELADNAAGAALDHASPKGWGVDKRMSLNGDRPTANGKDATKNRITRVTEDVLEDVRVRRVIRNAILSGRIDEAIELITHHLPTFLPVTTPDISIPSPAPNTQSGSHDPSQTKPIVSSSILPEPSSSGATTPVEPAPEPVQPSEKAAQKIDVPAIDASQAGSPKRTSAQETPVLDGVPRRHTSSSLGGSVNPVHILLNLRVQQFLEAVRTVPLESNMDEQNGRGQEDTGSDVKMHAPGSPTASEDSGDLQESHVTSSPPTQDVICSTARQQRLFELASQLYQKVKGLKCSADREIYEKEIEQVCSLMISSFPEGSLAAPYLSMARREAVADQVNSSMLHYIGESPAPALQIWAQTTKVVWDQIISAHIALPRAADIPTDVKMYARYVSRPVEGEEERSQAQAAVPFDFSALAQA